MQIEHSTIEAIEAEETKRNAMQRNEWKLNESNRVDNDQGENEDENQDEDEDEDENEDEEERSRLFNNKSDFLSKPLTIALAITNPKRYSSKVILFLFNLLSALWATNKSSVSRQGHSKLELEFEFKRERQPQRQHWGHSVDVYDHFREICIGRIVIKLEWEWFYVFSFSRCLSLSLDLLSLDFNFKLIHCKTGAGQQRTLTVIKHSDN